MVRLLVCLMMLCLLGLCGRAGADVVFTGNLLDRPCQLDPASAGQDVIFSDSALPQFHNAPGKSHSKNFAIKLLNCRAESIGKIVKVVFSGEPEQRVPGALKVSGVNSGRLAIQIIDTDGKTPLALGDVHHAGNGEVIASGIVTLNFSAYVQATPEAMADKSVQPGDYSAIATFEINYQ